VKHGSLFTGVGGLDLGFEAAGIETVWQCEINKQARSVLAKHWPTATRYTDVCEVDGAAVAPVDVISFGSPCQDLSIAGNRAGFQDGTRSNLYFEAVRIIKEMRDATKNQYPRYAIWENVRGALSSNGGKDFLAAIQALADLGAVDISWRLVNTCHFGPPQRRVRVFLVADFGGERAGEILSEPTRVCWHPSEIGETGRETSGETEEGVGVSGWVTARDTASTLQTGGPAGTRIDVEAAAGGQLLYKNIANCLSTSNQRIDYETETFVVEPVRASVPRMRGGKPGGGKGPLIKIEEQAKLYQYDGYNQKLETDGIRRTLRTGKDSGDFVAKPYVKIIRSGARDAEGNLPAEVWAERSIGPTLNVFDNAGESRATVVVPESSYRVRRLTPRECERLQGWPDDHTRWDDTGKEMADSARYKMCGNGISAPVAQWLGENLIGGSK
jgi:DNA (cytosine-5)-methyltransferase 1